MLNREEIAEWVLETLEQPVAIPLNAHQLRRCREMIREEGQELMDELNHLAFEVEYKQPSDERMIEDLSRVIDEMADLQIVLSGLAATFGINLEEAFLRKAAAQHSKINPHTGRVEKDPVSGKTLKGKNYQKPNFTDLAKLVVAPLFGTQESVEA